MTTDQQIALFETLDEPRSRVFCGLCMCADLRREEALGLMWTDIEDGKLTVRRTTTFIRNQPDEDTSLKTKAAARTIPIPQALQDILDDTPRRALYIVPPARDQIMTQSAFSRMWLHHVTNLVDFAVRPHMLRHTYASILHVAGVDLKTAQYLMGHSNICVTANIIPIWTRS